MIHANNDTTTYPLKARFQRAFARKKGGSDLSAPK
jgi:hypothetical protein